MLAVARGDEAAFEELLRRHGDSAWRLACRFLADASEAQDVVQEAFLNILRAAPRYRATAAFRTYLARVVSRLCLDRARKKRPSYMEMPPERPDREPPAIDGIAARERDRAVRRALEDLPPKQRMTVVLAYYEGLGHRRIAETLEISQKAAERLLSRGRAALEGRLRKWVEE